MKRASAEWRKRLSAACTFHGRALFRLAYGILRDAYQAEDVCQTAILRALEREEQLSDAATLKGWLTRVVVNESLQVLRRRKTEQRHRAAQALATTASEAAQPDGDLRDAALAALSNLPETTAMIVVLRVMEGRSGNEVKELLGCSAAEVSRRLHVGMAQLRERLRPEIAASQ